MLVCTNLSPFLQVLLILSTMMAAIVSALVVYDTWLARYVVGLDDDEEAQ